MAERDLLATIETVHAAALDESLWTDALAATAGLLGGSAAMLEVFAPPSQVPIEFRGYAIPPAGELAYFEHYAALSPRAAHAFGPRSGELLCDYQFLDEGGMERDPYYAKFLPQAEFRYFVAGKLFHDERGLAAVSVQRTRRQGHVDRAEMALMRRLLPHFRLAFDAATRLRAAKAREGSLERALSWLADGVALLAADGAVLFANDALGAILRRNDGLAIRRGSLAFASSRASAAFAAALAAVALLHDGEPALAGPPEFRADRPSGAPPYLVSLRPLSLSERCLRSREGAVAMLIVRDSSRLETVAARTLREVFGLTAAEASLGNALLAGRSVEEHARLEGVSVNTAYTHLRRMKDKLGCRRIPELIRKLNAVRLPLRTD